LGASVLFSRNTMATICDPRAGRAWLTSGINTSATSLTGSVCSLASVPEEEEDEDVYLDGFASEDSGSDSEEEESDCGDEDNSARDEGDVTRASSSVSSLLEVVRADYDSGDETSCDISKHCLASELKTHDSLAILIEMMQPFTEEAKEAGACDGPRLQDSFELNRSSASSSRSSSRSPTRADLDHFESARQRRYAKVSSSFESPSLCEDASAARTDSAFMSEDFDIADLLSGRGSGSPLSL
jgi:hypothetical protein